MVRHQGEKLHGGHLEGDGDVLIGVHHDDVVVLVHGLEVGPTVVGGHRHILRQVKVFPGQVRDILVDLHALDFGAGTEILPALCGVGTAAHAQNQHGKVLFFRDARHQRRRQGRVVVHAGEAAVLLLDGLDAEEHVGGEDHGVFRLLYLQIIVDGFSFIKEVRLPEGEGVRVAQDGAQQKGHGGSAAAPAAGLAAQEVHKA